MRVTRSSANRNAESEAEAAEAAAGPSRPSASGSRVSGSGPTKVETKTKSRGRKRVNADADEDRGTDKESTSKRRASASRAVGGKTDEREREQEQEQQRGNSRSSTSKRNACASGDKTTTTKSHSAASADPTPTHTPQPPFPGRVSLDPAFYPHLLDTILEHHTAADLVSLRATCRALRERVDVQLARHLVLKFRTREKNSVHVVPRVFELDYRFSALPGTWGELDHWRPLFEHTRVLDLCGTVSERLNPTNIAKLSDVPVVRLRGHVPSDATYWFNPRTVIVLGDGGTQCVECPSAMEKLVFTMPYRASEDVPTFFGKLNYHLGEHLSHVVFIIDKRAVKKPSRWAWSWPGRDESRIDWMDIIPILMMVAKADQPPKITFVDVAQNMELPPSFLEGGEEGQEEEEEQHAAGDNVQHGQGSDAPSTPSSTAFNRRLVRAFRKEAAKAHQAVNLPARSQPEFEFLTREEYKARVGDEVFALEKGI